MGWTTEDLKAIEDAIANGTKRVKYTDKEVEYRDLKELLQARDLIRNELGITEGRNKRLQAEFSRGY